MNSTYPKIRWTFDCAMSCFLFRVWPEEMLVCFLQNVKYHAYVSGTNCKLTAAACHFVKTYGKVVANLTEYSSRKKYTRVKCLKLLKAVLSDSSISPAKRIEKLDAVILQCKNLIVERHHFEEKIRLHVYEIGLPPDFIVTCFLNRISPQHLILDFFKNIDYVGYLAKMPISTTNVNGAIDFFFLFAA